VLEAKSDYLHKTKDSILRKKKAQNIAGVPGSQSTLADSRAIHPSSRAQNRNSFTGKEKDAMPFFYLPFFFSYVLYL